VLAVALLCACSLVSMAQYSNTLMSEQSAWLAFEHSMSLVGVFLPIFGSLAVGDTLAGDRASGYIFSLATRIPWTEVVAGKVLVMVFVSASVVIIGLVPAALIALFAYPTSGTALLLPGLLPSAFHGSLWLFTVVDVAIMSLSSAAWVVTGALVVAGFSRKPLLAVMGPSAVYFVLALATPFSVNPMVHSNLLAWVPASGPIWVSVIVWSGLLLLAVTVGMYRWMKGGVDLA